MSGDHPQRNGRRLENQPAAEEASALLLKGTEGSASGELGRTPSNLRRNLTRQLSLARRQLEQVFVAGDADEGCAVTVSTRVSCSRSS